MRHPSLFKALSIAAAFLFATSAWAGEPVLLSLTALDDGFNFNSPSVGTPVTTTITLTYHSNTTGFIGTVSGAIAAGLNANPVPADFALLGTGSCANTPTTPLTDGQTCTIVVRYTPTSTAEETAQLNVTCAPIALSGGFTLTCNSNGTTTTGPISLFGFAAAAVAAIPASLLDPKLLTLLCAMLLSIGIFFAARRN